MNKKDIFYLLALLLFPLWVVVLQLSGCEIVDGPFAFVRGCTNHDISWNQYIAPTGMISIFIFPVSLLYFSIRITKFLFVLVKRGLSDDQS